MSDDIIVAFTNQTATKPLFYTQSNETIIISSDLFATADLMKANTMSKTIDMVGLYSMLTYGYFIEERTYLQEVKKLKAGQFIEYNGDKSHVNSYHSFNGLTKNKVSYKDSILRLDELFEEALHLEYQKELDNQYDHMSTLSAGLDSRANMLIAHKLGYKKQFAITCSQEGFYDDWVAKEIASDYQWKHFFWPLDKAEHLCHPEKYIHHNDGIVFLAGASQHRIMMEQLDISNYGLLHTGQLGKLGGFVPSSTPTPPNVMQKAFSTRFLHKIESELRPVEQRYANQEALLLYNRTFNHTNTGYFINEDFNYMVSPFYDIDFLEFSMAMPEKFKHKEKIYFDWWGNKHPEILNYIWDAIQMKPNASWKRNNARIINIFRNGFQRKVLGQQYKYEMTPETYWYNTNKRLQEVTQSTFDQNIHLLDAHKEAQKDAILLFSEGNYNEKNQVLTALLALKHLI